MPTLMNAEVRYWHQDPNSLDGFWVDVTYQLDVDNETLTIIDAWSEDEKPMSPRDVSFQDLFDAIQKRKGF